MYGADNDSQRVARDLDGNVLQVVLSHPTNRDLVNCHGESDTVRSRWDRVTITAVRL